MGSLKFLIAFVLVVLAASVATDVTNAQGPDGGGTLRPDLGPDVPGLTAGVGGYKVFGSNAIKKVPARPRGQVPNSLDTVYRAGWTDAYVCGNFCHAGSHTSQSDLVEQEIWADGAIGPAINVWRASCSQHTAGQFANCQTQYTPSTPGVHSVAKSWHHFHKTGYGDSNFQTQDSL